MEKSVKITLIIVSAIVILALIGVYVAFQFMPSNTIDVTGNAQVKVTPDLVTVYFNAESKGSTAVEAKDANSAIVDSLTTALIKQGFTMSEIQTSGFSINPNYVWQNNQNVQQGWIASQQIEIVMNSSRIDEMGSVVDAGVNAGANVNYIQFELSQELQNKYKADALKLASQDATNKAQAIASGLGKKVGRIVSISAVDFNYYPRPLYESNGMGDVVAAKAATLNIIPSSQDVNAQVQVTFALR